MTLADLQPQVRAARSRLERQAGEARAVALRGRETQGRLVFLAGQAELYDRVIGVLTSIGEGRQAHAQDQIEALVTHGLQTIFGSDLSFHLVSSVQRKAANVDFIVRTTLEDGSTIDTPVMEARGGGLAAVVGFLLRLVVLLLSPQRQAPVLILDETFAHLSSDYEPRMSEFLRELVEKTPVQIILVTHSDAYSDMADRRYRFSLENGQTKVKLV